jgi:uncharacterized protein YbaP (TraB family)
MRHLIRISILAVFLSLSMLARPASCAERGVLFRLSLGTHVMHLFGTLHVGLPEFYPLEPRLMAALAAASTLALEMDPAPPRAELLRAMREHGMMTPGDSSYATLDPALRRRIDELVQDSGFEATWMRTVKPAMLATLLAVAEYTKLGYRIDLSSDAYLARAARRAGVRLLALETLDEQLALLDRLAPLDRWRFLQETVEAIDSGAQRANARAMAQAWSTADGAALEAMATRCASDITLSGRFAMPVLIQERNVGLAEKLMALLANEDRTVAAMGVLQLLGEGSVPMLLAVRGVHVERIY